jgi:hypothetical protein
VKKVVGSKVFGVLVAAIVGILIALVAFEAWALTTNNRPITGYVQTFIVDYGGFTAVGLYIVGVITGTLIYHFWNDPVDWNKGGSK